MNRRLIIVTACHAVLSSFGEIESQVLNLMNVPLKDFFNQSIINHYGVTLDEERFSIVFSGIAATMFVGLLVGAILMGRIMDTVGRRGTAIRIRCSLGVLCGVLMISAKALDAIELFAIAHFLSGIIAAFKLVLIVYVAECSPDHYRGLTTMAVGSGTVLANLVMLPLALPSVLANEKNWAFLPAICVGLALLHFLIAQLFPESPKHLYIAKHSPKSTREALIYYHGEEADTDELMDEYESEYQMLNEEHSSFKHMWQHSTLRWSFLIVMIGSAVVPFSVCNIKSQFGASQLMSFGLDQSEVMYALMIVTVAAAPFCVLAPLIIEKLGRRPLFLTCSALCCVELICVGVAQLIIDGSPAPTIMSIISGIAGQAVGQIAISLGLLAITPILISELCVQSTRAVVGQISLIFPVIFAAITVAVYSPIVTKFGALIYLPLLVGSCVTFGLLFYYLPETRKLPVNEIVKRLSVCQSRRNTLLRSRYGTMDAYDSHVDLLRARDLVRARLLEQQQQQ